MANDPTAAKPKNINGQVRQFQAVIPGRTDARRKQRPSRRAERHATGASNVRQHHRRVTLLLIVLPILSGQGNCMPRKN